MRPVSLEYAGPRRERTSPWSFVVPASAIGLFVVFIAYIAVSETRQRARNRGYKDTKARSELRQLNIGLHILQIEQGRFPTQEEGLDALWNPPPPPAAGKPIAQHLPRLDPWDRPYIYKAPTAQAPAPPRFRVLSVGPDGRQGTGDDISEGN